MARPNQVKRYNRATGAFIDVCVNQPAGPTGMTIHQGVPTLPTRIHRKASEVRRHRCEHRQLCTLDREPQSARREGVNPANNRLYVLYYNAATVETFDPLRPRRRSAC
jgi:hypothetical protein